MKFKASEDQVKKIVLSAARVSYPWFTESDVYPYLTCRSGSVFADYVSGVQVSIYAYYLGAGLYEISEIGDINYQSWRTVYPTTEALIRSVI